MLTKKKSLALSCFLRRYSIGLCLAVSFICSCALGFGAEIPVHGLWAHSQNDKSRGNIHLLLNTAPPAKQQSHIGLNRFFLWLGLYEGIPGEVFNHGPLSPETGSPAYDIPVANEWGRTESRASKKSKRRTSAHKGKNHKRMKPPPARSNLDEAREIVKQLSGIHAVSYKPGLMTKKQKTAAMGILKKRVEASGGDWKRLKNYYSELSNDKQDQLANAVRRLGNAIYEINKKTDSKVPDTAEKVIVEFEKHDAFIAQYTHYLIDAFASRIANLDRNALIERWSPLIPYLIPYVMTEYYWPSELYERWHIILRERYYEMIPDINLPSHLICHPQFYRAHFFYNSELDVKDVFTRYDACYSFLPHPVASLVLWQYINSINPPDEPDFYPGDFFVRLEEGDLLLQAAFQITISYWLDTHNQVLSSEQRLFIIVWLGLRNLEAHSFFHMRYHWTRFVHAPQDEFSGELSIIAEQYTEENSDEDSEEDLILEPYLNDSASEEREL